MNARAVLRLPSNAAVSVYLSGALLFLAATKKVRLPFKALAKLSVDALRPRHRGTLTEIRPESGFCYVAKVPDHLLSDKEEGLSRVVVLEDGVPLLHGHSGHEDIRRKGSGRYSHWDGQIYFSASDNSDPSKNGRAYAMEER